MNFNAFLDDNAASIKFGSFLTLSLANCNANAFDR